MAEMPQSKILRNRSSTPVVEFHEYVENQSRFPLIITRHKQILPTFVPSEQRREKPKKKNLNEIDIPYYTLPTREKNIPPAKHTQVTQTQRNHP